MRIAQFAHFLLAERGALKRTIGDLIASHMEDLERLTRLLMHLADFIDDFIDKHIAGWTRNANHIIGIILSAAIYRAVVRVNQSVLLSLCLHTLGHQSAISLFHGSNSGSRMPRHINLRDNANMERVSIPHNLNIILSGEKTIGRSGGFGIPTSIISGIQPVVLIERKSSPSAHLGEFGQPGNLKAPPLIVG